MGSDSSIKDAIIGCFKNEKHEPGDTITLDNRVGEYVVIQVIEAPDGRTSREYKVVKKEVFQGNRPYFSHNYNIPTPFENLKGLIPSLIAYAKRRLGYKQ